MAHVAAAQAGPANADPSDSYESDWIGDRRGGSETILKGGGTPVVGIVGKANDSDCVGLDSLFDK